MYIFIFN